MAKWHLAEFDDSPDYGNNANNSMEQQAAVENAVERAQELQSQGKADDEIVRTLTCGRHRSAGRSFEDDASSDEARLCCTRSAACCFD
jgi:hypothetical protein